MVRRSSREFEKDEIFDKEKRGNVEIEARLTTSIETILRYMTRLKRDLYKAIRSGGPAGPPGSSLRFDAGGSVEEEA